MSSSNLSHSTLPTRQKRKEEFVGKRRGEKGKEFAPFSSSNEIFFVRGEE